MKDEGQRRFHKLFVQNFRTALSLVALPLVLMMCLLIGTLVNQRNHEDQNRHEEAFAQAQTMLVENIERQMRVALNVSYDSNVRRLSLIDMSENSVGKYSALARVSVYFRALLNNDPRLSDIFLTIADDPSFFVRSDSAYHPGGDEQVYIIDQSSVSYAMTGTIYDRLTRLENSTGFVIAGDNLYYGRGLDSRGGSLVAVGLSNANLRAEMRKLVGSGRMLAAMDGVIVFDTKRGTIGTALDEVTSGWRGCMMTADTEWGWECVYLYDMDEARAFAVRVGAICVGIMLAMLLLCVYLSRRISVRLIRPYQTIFQMLSSPDGKALEHYDKKYSSGDELGLIYALIHETQYQNLALQGELTEREMALANAQNIALQSQITPHFLFNTLEAINWRLFEKLPEEVEIPRMIQKLSLLFRMTLDSKERLVPLEREMIYAQAYLELQAIRFENSYQVQWEIDNSARSCLVVRMCLQPLLENTISYGVTRVEEGLLTIRAMVENGSFVLEVEDNGPGWSEDELKKWQALLRDSRYAHSDHIGLINVNARVQLLFGVDYGLSIESIPYESTRVRLRMPLMREGDSVEGAC